MLTLPIASRQITPDEAERAVYIDFEGRRDKPPVLLGAHYMTGPNFDRAVMIDYILDRRFDPFADRYALPVWRFEVRCCSITQATNEILLLARSRDRLVVSWSRYDGELIARAPMRAAIAAEFESRYRDGKATAKRWHQRCHSDTQLPKPDYGGRHSLANYMKLVGYTLPDARYGTGLTGNNLGRLEDALKRRSTWEELTDTQRRSWVDVAHHNLHDCLALAQILAVSAADS